MERQYWKRLDEMSTKATLSEEYSAQMNTEFSSTAGDMIENSNGLNRRSFIGLLSASMALAATSCRRPDHKIVPVVKASEYLTPGLSTFYSTVFSHGNLAVGVVAKTRDGRPVKLEGNEKHVASMGSSSAWIQGSLLSLYDPDRMKNPFVNKGGYTPSTTKKVAPGFVSPDTAIATMADGINASAASGKVTRILIGEHASPSFDALLKEVEILLPNAKVVVMPALHGGNTAEANKAVLGMDTEFVTDYSKAEVILSVDADFLGTDKNAVHNIKSFAKTRKPSFENPNMSKLIVAESMMSLTGMNADKRVRVAPDQLVAFLAAVAKGVGAGVSGDDAGLSAEVKADAEKISAELKAASGKAVVSVGDHLPAGAHALGIAINAALGAFGAGKAIDTAHQIPMSNSKNAAIVAFREELKGGKVGAVVFAGVNPMYSADAETQELLKKVEHRYAFSLYQEETSAACTAYVPAAHYLESWGDAMAFDGSISIQQPVVAPLNPNSFSLQDLLMKLAKAVKADAFASLGERMNYVEYLRARWTASYNSISGEKPATFDAYWAQVLRDGVAKAGAVASPAANVNAGAASALVSQAKVAKADLVCVVTPSYAHYDGSVSNTSWFMELSDPVTKTTWDNLALMSPKTAEKLFGAERAKELNSEHHPTELIRVKSANGVVELPAWVQYGMADGVIATTTGWGRTAVGQVAENVGANAYALMGAEQSNGYVAVTVELTGKKYKIASTQRYSDLIGRKLALDTTLDKVKSKSEHLIHKEEVPGKETEKNSELPKSIMKSFQYNGHRWGMTIDMSACVGCGACITACQAENNIAVVGKEHTANARDMHWIRIDRYYGGSDMENNPEVTMQPMLCQHCENAPCENVCPVAATTHSPEGLNEMTYNRCVGTKYCANNCPYKVRRFNWLNWHKGKRTPMEFVHNPDVTVRMRGVMEKCSFCTQRITEARQKTKDAGELYIKDGSFQTACQQACPANAIVFGNTNDGASMVSKSRTSERGFLILEELNVRPQITYLAKVRNAEGKKEAAHEGGHHG
jgi:molybdopterin-containing oxidoreductase family iron-sulfur binding subunit